jgi:hypothetical protein
MINGSRHILEIDTIRHCSWRHTIHATRMNPIRMFAMV